MQINLMPGLVPLIILILGLLGWLLFYWTRHYPERYAITRFIHRNKIQLVLSFLCFSLLTILLIPVIFIPVPYGHSAVIWKRFQGGTQMGLNLDEGTLLVMPWDKAYIYSTQYKILEHEFEAATINGLTIKINTVIRYRVKHDSLSHLHVNVGEDYINRLLLPEVGSRARIEIAKHTAEEVYAKQRLEVQNSIWETLQGDVQIHEGRKECTHIGISVDANCSSADYIELQEFLIRQIVLPEGIHEAIVRKIEKVYLEEEYKTRVKIARKEAERKLEEAKGIANFQKTVTGGISDTYLRWRGIEATLELAKSNNAKVVVIGGGKDGLPIILNTESGVQADPAGTNKILNNQHKTQVLIDKLNSNLSDQKPKNIEQVDPAKKQAVIELDDNKKYFN